MSEWHCVSVNDVYEYTYVGDIVSRMNYKYFFFLFASFRSIDEMAKPNEIIYFR